jgi:hypothetical protein
VDANSVAMRVPITENRRFLLFLLDNKNGIAAIA